MQKPSVGRIVHFCELNPDNNIAESTHRAAIITSVLDAELYNVTLTVFPVMGFYSVPFATYSDDLEPFSWHFPEVV